MEENQEKQETNKNLEVEENLNENKNEEILIQEQEVKQNQEENEKNEIIEVKKKNKKSKKRRYITGTIGAILGGFVVVLPWILRYIFARKNFVLTLLSMVGAILIPVGSYLGYKIFRGKIGKAFPVIITVISLIIITIVTAVICPVYLIIEEGYPLTWQNYRDIFSDIQKEARTAIIEDTIAGLIFTIIGSIITIKLFIKKQLDNLKTEEEKNKKHGKLKKIIITIIILVVICIIIAMVLPYIIEKTLPYQTIPDTDVQLSVDASQKLYKTTESITEEFGERVAASYDFIIKDSEEELYDVYGQIVSKTDFAEYNLDTLIQDDREYYASYYTEEMTSEIYHKEMGDINVKSYNYKYVNSENEILMAIVYLYETEENYVFMNIYDIDLDTEITKLDTVIDNILN